MTATDTIVGHLDEAEQRALLFVVHDIVHQAPLTPMPDGMTVSITNAGPVGWWAHTVGRYEYVDRHPRTGRAWPKIPRLCRDIFRRFASDPREPDCVHIVWYAADAKLGYHRDKTEADLTGTVITGGLMGKKDDKPLEARWGVEGSDGIRTRAWLHSGDVTRLEGGTRNLMHSIESMRTHEQPPEAAQNDFFSTYTPPPFAVLDTPGRVAVSIRSGAGPT